MYTFFLADPVFIQQIWVLNILNIVYTLRFFFIQQIWVLNILNNVHALRFFFPLQNAVCFIILTYLVPVLFTFYIQCVLKLKK